jgi:DNA-binding MarR family transcriptional regulator
MKDACPWTEVDPHGAGLQLEDFLSFQVVRLASALQRVSSRVYLEPHDLTGPDWRVLSFVRQYGPVRFSELALRTSLDKAQISRTVKSLRERGLISADGDAEHAQRVVLDTTPAGRRLHARILPEAARTQARLLRALEPGEREALWSALHKLQHEVRDAAAPAERKKA